MDEKEQVSLMPADLPEELREFANWLQGAVPLSIYLQTIRKVIILLSAETKKAEVRGAIKSLEKVAKLYRKKELQSEARRAISIGVFRELDQLKEIEQSLQESEWEG